MFVGSNLVLQWVPRSGKVVRGDIKMSPASVSRVCYRGVSSTLRKACQSLGTLVVDSTRLLILFPRLLRVVHFKLADL